MAEKKADLQQDKLLWRVLLPIFVPQLLLSIAVTVGVLYGGYYFCDCIPVPKSADFGDKMTYYIRCCVFPCSVSLLIAIIGVSNKRGSTLAFNPLAGKEHLLQFEKNVLMNTLEQIVLFLMTTLALATYLDGAEMKILPLYSILWVIGRILFRIGYGIHPKYRSFGMMINLVSVGYFISVVAYLMYTRGFMYGVPSEMARVGTGGTPKTEL